MVVNGTGAVILPCSTRNGTGGHAASLMMDRATLEAHRDVWGMEDQPYTRDLHRLTPDEQDLYNDLRDNRFGKQLRLEQEQLGFGWVRESLGRLVGA